MTVLSKLSWFPICLVIRSMKGFGLLLLPLFLLGASLSGTTTYLADTRTSPSCPSTPGHSARVLPVAELLNEDAASIVTLVFADESNQLIVVSNHTDESSGIVRFWDLNTHQIVRELEIAPVHPENTALSPDGLLLTTIETRPERIAEYQGQADSPIIEVTKIWDMVTGENFEFLGKGRFPTKSLVVANGGQLIKILGDGVTLFRTHRSGASSPRTIWGALSPEDATYRPEVFVAGALNRAGDLFALGLENGLIYWQETEEFSSENIRRLSPYDEVGGDAPVAMALDGTGKRLAILYPTALEVRDLDAWYARFWQPFLSWVSNPTYVKLPPADSGQVAFSGNDNVIAVGTLQGWQLRHTNNLALLAEGNDISVTSLAFSEDGCYVAFGTDNGLVQVWSLTE